MCSSVAVLFWRCAVLSRAVFTRAVLTQCCFDACRFDRAVLSRAVSSRAVLSRSRFSHVCTLNMSANIFFIRPVCKTVEQ
uniref:Putative secreted protein n=1 Tax=Ixodes ricinus TaxID=34613 RepID=A0A6B0TVN8_IXORI